MLFLNSLKKDEKKNRLPKSKSYLNNLAMYKQPLIGKIFNRLKKTRPFHLCATSGIDSSKNYFWNQTFDKGRLKNFVLWFFLKYGEHKTVRLVEELKTIGFQYATKAGISLGVEDLKIPPKKAALINEAESLSVSTIRQFKRGEITEVERFQRLIDTWHRTSEQLKIEVIENFEGTDVLNPVYMMAFSGARGNISQVRQLVGMRGLMSNPQGQIIDFPIRSNFREGLTLTEYIISSYGARKGIVDTALRTANAGYLTRRLVDVAQHVIISSTDCGTTRGIFLTDMKEGNKTIYSLQNRLIGRVLARDIYTDNAPPASSNGLSDGTSNKKNKIASKNTEISGDLATLISQHHKKVFVRSALTCQTNKLVCQLCYGWSLAQGNLVSIGEAVGIVAAQSIGEPGTQLTMRTFHTGGVFAGNVSDQIKAPFDGFVIYTNPIAGKLIRTPEGKIAFLTKDEGSFSVYKMPTSSGNEKAFNTKMGNFSPKLTNLDTLEKRNFKIPFYTLLFLRNGEKTFQKQVIAQISSINRQKTATDQAEFTIKAEISGLFYSKNLDIEERKVGPIIKDNSLASMSEGYNEALLDIINFSWSWGYAWILSGKIYQLPLPSSFFTVFGDFVNKKSFLNCVNWYMPNTFGSGFKLNRPLNLTFFNTKSLKVMRNNTALTSSNVTKQKHQTVSSLASVNIKKTGLIEKDFKLLKFDLISFELSKITYKNIGYFLKLSKPVSEGPLFVRPQQKNLVNLYEKNKSIKTTSSEKSILSPQDHLFLFSSLFSRNRFFNALKTNKSLQTNTRNPLINPSTWESSFNVFLNWFPKRFFTQTAGIIFFDTNACLSSVGVPSFQNNLSLYSKALSVEQRRNFYVDSSMVMFDTNLKNPKTYLNFTLSKTKSNSLELNKKLMVGPFSTPLGQSLKQNLKALSFPTFLKKDLLEKNNNISKVGFSKNTLKSSKKSNSSFLSETQNVKNQTGLNESSINPLEFQVESTFKTNLNKKLKLNNLLQTLMYEQYPKNLLGSSSTKNIDGTTGMFGTSGALQQGQGVKHGYSWKNSFKYNWGLSNNASLQTRTKNIFKRAFWVQQPFYKIRDKNNSIIITSKNTNLAFVQTNRQGKTRLIEFNENCAQVNSINNQVNGICLQSNKHYVKRLKTLNFFNLFTTTKTKKNESRNTSKGHTQNNILLQPFKKETFYHMPATFAISAPKKQENLVKRKYIFGLFPKNNSISNSMTANHSNEMESLNQLTTLKSYCKTTSIPYFLPKKIKTFFALKKPWFSLPTNKNSKNLITLSLLSSRKNTANKNDKSKQINLFNFYFYSLFNKKSKNKQSANSKKLLKNKYQLICSPYLENQIEQKLNVSLLKGQQLSFNKLLNLTETQIFGSYMPKGRRNAPFRSSVSSSKSGKTEMFQRTQQLLNWYKKVIYSENKYFEPKTFKKWYKKPLDVNKIKSRAFNFNSFISNTPENLKNLSTFYSISSGLKRRKQSISHTNGYQQNTNRNSRKNTINKNKSQRYLQAKKTNLNLWLKNGYFYYTTDLTKFFLYNKKIIQPGTNFDPHFSFDKNNIYLEIIPLKKQSLKQTNPETDFLVQTDFNSSGANAESLSKKQRSGASGGDTENKLLQGHIALNKKIFIKEEKWLKSFQKEHKIKIIKEKVSQNPKTDDKEQSLGQHSNWSQSPPATKIIELDFSQTILNNNCRFKIEKNHENLKTQFPEVKTNQTKNHTFSSYYSQTEENQNNISFPLNTGLEGKKRDVVTYIIFIRKAKEYKFVKPIEYKKDIYSLANHKNETGRLSNIKTNINTFYRNKLRKTNSSMSYEQSLIWPSIIPGKLEVKRSFNSKKENNFKQKNKLTIDADSFSEKSNKSMFKNKFLQLFSNNKQFVELANAKNKSRGVEFLNFKSTKLKKKLLNQSFYSIRLYSNYQTSLLNKQKTTGQIISKYGSSQLKLIFNNTILSEILKKETDNQKSILPLDGLGEPNNFKTDKNVKNQPLFDNVRKWGVPSVMMTSLTSINLAPFILSYKSPYSVNFPFKTPICFFSQQYQPSFIFNNPWEFNNTKSVKQKQSWQESWLTTTRLSRYKQLKNLEYTTLKQLLSNYIYKIKGLDVTDRTLTKKDFGYNAPSAASSGQNLINSKNIENKHCKNNLFELGKNISNLSSIFFSPIVDYSLINEFPKSIPAAFQEQTSTSSIDGQRASIFNNTNLKKQNLFLTHSDNKKFLFGKNGPLLPSLAGGSPTSNNSFARFNQTNEELASKIKTVLYKTDFVSYIDNSVNSQNPVLKTYAYSSIEGELIYQKKMVQKMELEPSSLYNDIMALKKGFPGLSINKLIRRKFTDFFLSTKPVDHIEYSCMILTKNDQICYSLSPKKIDGAFNQKQNNKQKYKEIYFSLEKQKIENQYFINNIVINLLNLLATENNTNVTTNTEESSDSSKYQIDELFSGFLKNTWDDASTKSDGSKNLSNSDNANALAQSGTFELNKIPAGLAQQRSKLLIGEFLVYGDKINPTLAISKSGQIIHINNHKVTLRKGQPIFVSPQAILHKYDGDFVEEQSSVITLAYQQLKTGDIVQGIPKIEQFFEARTTKRGRLFRDSLENLLKAIFNRYNTKLPREQAVRQSFYKIQQIIIDGVQRVYRSQGVTIADKHLEVIVKQMTSKVRITFGGSTGYLPGEICDLYDIELINKDIRPKILYEPIVLGITKASLEVKSFLSAASFQQTTRVLTKAALSRKTDYLNGLKENVILGNLIPAGTGYLVYLDQYSTNN